MTGKIDPFSEVSQINHFYPFGLNMEGNWNGAAGAYKKQYNGKEWNDDLGWNMNDYGARWYDPAVARWLELDPMANKLPSWSPYVLSLNNPISVIDPNGRFPIYFMIRRYESSSYFAFPMESDGDGRQSSANVNATARIHHFIGIETNTSWVNADPVINDYAISSSTRQYLPYADRATEKPTHYTSGDILTQNTHISALNFQFTNAAQNPVPKKKLGNQLVPAIDTKGNIGVNILKDKNEMQVFGSIRGDAFPDAEGFLYDAK